jgi:hypothetical protein
MRKAWRFATTSALDNHRPDAQTIVGGKVVYDRARQGNEDVDEIDDMMHREIY